MKQLIKDVLEDMSQDQINLASETARETIATVIISAIRASDKGWYLDLDHSEEREKEDKKILESRKTEEWKVKESWVCSICGKNTYDVDWDYIGSGTNHLGCELESEMKGDKRVTKDRRKDDRREKNYSQKKHEEKVFGHDQGGSYEKKTWPGLDSIQKRVYSEMTSDGLPPGGDTQAVLESHKLDDEIDHNQKGKWI